MMRKLTHDEIAAQRVSKERLGNIERLPLFGMLDNIRSLYNVGSMFRTSDGALVRKLFLSGYTPRPPRKEIEKTALGATETVPWEYHPTAAECIAAIRREGALLCILEHTTKSIPYYEIERIDLPLCLVVGNEINGISTEVVAAADLAIDIPMFGTKQSLNASVAFGIALFEMVKKIQGPKQRL
jgi:tRNA G18 (ribose-2'-O)-methylase SpoU